MVSYDKFPPSVTLIKKNPTTKQVHILNFLYFNLTELQFPVFVILIRHYVLYG
jgi:hypothetical protein